jgi:putative endonuclease
MESTKHRWDTWELIAIKYLQKNGYTILDTNFKFGRFWEVDIICEKNGIVYFMEVKYRTNDKFWTWEEAITKSKLHKLKWTISSYILKNNLNQEKVQFDIIIITKWKSSYQVKHYKNLEI